MTTTRKPSLGLARKLRDDVHKVTGGALQRWVSVDELWLRHPYTSASTLESAIALAISKGWMIGEGTPVHSICLTDDGRRLAQ